MNLEKCYTNYNNLINTDMIDKLTFDDNNILNFVEECIEIFYNDKSEKTHDTFTGNKCKRITKKQDKLYIYIHMIQNGF